MIKIRIQALVCLLALQSNAQTNKQNSFHYIATDSIVSSISTRYKAGWMQRLVMGDNYRKVWSTPVKLPVFHLSQTALQITGLGGSKQTKSIHFKDKTGKEWVLRRVDKDVSAGVITPFRYTLIKNLMQDMISALYPYSQVITAQLAKAAHVVQASPQIYFVADDEALGTYRFLFANKICTLEENAPSPDGSTTIATGKVVEKLTEKNNRSILQKQVLQARLLDMLIGDWDRHFNQWTWAAIDSENRKYYYVIPEDRDNAFFYSDGLLEKLFYKTLWPYYRGFTRRSTQLKKLNFKAREFDRLFLNELDADTWQQEILRFQQMMNDSAIEASVKILPEPTYKLNGELLISKLKSRRNGLLKNAMQYYTFLSSSVTIKGSDEDELFIVKGSNNKLLVSVFQKNEPNQKMYERLFDPSETNSIELNGLKGNDQFIIEESARSVIALKIYGGEGSDVYDVKGNMKTKIFDSRKENNRVLQKGSAKFYFR